MRHDKVNGITVLTDQKSQLVSDSSDQKILAVCEHFSFYPLISFEVLNISLLPRRDGFLDRYFTRYVINNPFETPLPDETFDLVICDKSYQDFENFEALADEIYRLLKVGGFCYFSGLGLFSLNRNKVATTRKYYLAKGNLRKKLSNFWIHDYTPLIKENPGIFNGNIISPPGGKRILRVLPEWLFFLFFNEFVWILTKKK